jgi:hypothetical protein
VPSRLGGVNIPSQRRYAIQSLQKARSSGVIPQASSGVRRCGTIGRGSTGKGCVGQDSSPGTGDA